MGLKKEEELYFLDVDLTFDQIVEKLQEDINLANGKQVKPKDSSTIKSKATPKGEIKTEIVTIPAVRTRRYSSSGKKTSVVSMREYKRKKERNKLKKDKDSRSEKFRKDSKDSSQGKILKFRKPDEKRREDEAKRKEREFKREEEKRRRQEEKLKSQRKKETFRKNQDEIKQRRILEKQKEREKNKREKKRKREVAKISKQIHKNIMHQTRYTEPKRRNILSRLILQKKLERGDFEEIDDNYDYLGQQKVDESKNAEKRSDRRFYREVQKYEDAKEDTFAKATLTGIRVSLATLAIAGTIGVVAATYNIANGFIQDMQTYTNKTEIVSVEDLSHDQQIYYEGVIEDFEQDVIEKDGYHFDNLSYEELLDGYIKIMNVEEKMIENTFKAAFLKMEDQEALEKILVKAFGEETYATFTDEQKRDYMQEAYEILPIALPEIFEETSYIRNPIVMEHLAVRDTAQAKGYKITLKMNNNQKQNLKNFGNLLHLINTMEDEDFIPAEEDEDGQTLLENMLKEACSNYDEFDKTEKRDFMQVAYELLPESAKENITDPIEVDRQIDDMVLGE